MRNRSKQDAEGLRSIDGCARSLDCVKGLHVAWMAALHSRIRPWQFISAVTGLRLDLDAEKSRRPRTTWARQPCSLYLEVSCSNWIAGRSGRRTASCRGLTALSEESVGARTIAAAAQLTDSWPCAHVDLSAGLRLMDAGSWRSSSTNLPTEAGTAQHPAGTLHPPTTAAGGALCALKHEST